ncbi:polyketide synthase-nonribosomal peptide synthetase [Aspergillus awamori]|uniref:Polyketide synthase-nonribosomal peptide synthetase n=1 Tax=Aspergillus awamori TaxID=105351 RepID=A0A401KRG5_ASPAW|nr:polyketide synthase-nonribosomal peptide synthetase [Aspergillus awamori]
MAGDLRGRRTSQGPEVSTKESSPGFSPFESGSSVTSIDGPNPAVLVGYACRVAGADRPSKLWDNLVQQKDVRCKMPANRFNVDNFFHPDGTHKGTTNAKYGYYLDQDLGHFDRSFFHISGKEAEAMDPQQRLILEVVYEALEDAGITLEEINGSRTSVLCGSFTNDYNAMLTKDLEHYPSYTVTGTGNAILSNRVSYVFNLQGMSLTIDTACSSSLVAFHLGAQSVQSGDCDTSIIVGSALHFDPNIFITMTDLGMLSEEGRSRAFAAGVKGYARGDGVCAVILRGQRQAELHGDDIRAVVRATGSNHDGTKQGITLPSAAGQEELIWKTYRSAGLDPADTTYVEAHGTGTGRGDPLETKALGTVFGSKRRQQPLYVGSIKSNIGHTEGASGLAGIIKATMALEKGQIPPNMHFKIPNPDIKFDEWQIEVPTQLVEFPLNAHGHRRVSINSFGYGGANAHVVLEDYRPHTIQERPPIAIPAAFKAAAHERPFLVPLTSHTDKAGDLWTEKLVEYLDKHEGCHVADLALSLSTSRSMHAQRSYAIGKNVTSIRDSLRKVPAWTKASKQSPRLGFVFTGQGAQWYAMGRQLMQESPIFLQTLQRTDQVLKALPDGPKWSVVEELSRTKGDSQLSQTHLSQPICTALQLAILELLKSWGVEPTAVVGHSSGEMGAAYAAGILSFESAMYAAYYRGLHMSSGAAQAGPDAVPGAMMAVGLGETEALAELEAYKGRAVIAAVNSPSSVTLSGDEDAIIEVQKNLEARKIFARRLQVAQAFHSHHMFPLAPAYAKALNDCPGFSSQPSDKARMFSSVTARVADADQMGAEYWTANMTGTVRFSDALVGILLDDSENQNVDVLVEIGPHPALRGPARQVMKSLNMDLPYFASLTRGTPDYDGILGLAGQLFQVGYPVNLPAVNSDAYLSESGHIGIAPRGRRLKDLPSYAWDHSERYWAETRLIHNHRLRTHRHSLLGHQMAGSIDNHVRWRNYLRLRELPWLADHVIDGKVLFPAAGYMSLAFEAVARTREGIQPTQGFALRNVSIKAALVLDDSDMGTELIVDLHPQVTSAVSRSDTWYEFKIFSYDGQYNCTEHCSGLVAIDQPSTTLAAPDRDRRLKSSTVSAPVSRYYRHLSDIGLQYGDEFRLLTGSIESGPGFACSNLTFSPDQYAKQPADVTFVHPTMLDATFHTIFPALEQVLGHDLDSAFIPTFVESCHIYPTMLTLKDAAGPQEVWVDTATQQCGFRSAVSQLHVEMAATGQPLLAFSGLRVTSLGSGIDANDRSLFFRTRWQVAFDQLSADASRLAKTSRAELVDMFVHQHPNTQILHVTAGVEETEQVLQALSGPSGGCSAGEAWEQLAGRWPGLVLLEEPTDQSYDLAIVTAPTSCSVVPFLKQNGQASVWKTATTTPDESSSRPLVIVHASPPSSRTVDLISRLGASLKHHADVAVLASLDSPLFMDRDSTSESVFDAARALLLRPQLNLLWLLEGATDQVPENPVSAMIIGLMRVARIENEGSRIVTLDVPLESSPKSVVPFITQLLNRDIVDEEWSLRDQTLFIPRIEADDALNAKVRGGVSSGPKLESFSRQRPIKLTVGQVGRLETLVWEDDEEMLQDNLGPDELEIEVRASTVSARDVAAATGTIDDYRLGDECAGLPGDKVLAIRPGQGAHRSVVRNPASCCFRLGPMPFEDAAALPQILVTPYYALVEIARLQAKESVLIHAAASGVGQMAVQIAQMVGANVIATAGSEAQRALLTKRFVDGVQQLTGGRGVDVVLNSLTGNLLHGSWRCVAAFGRFVEIGTQDIRENAMLEMAPFQRNALGARLFQEVCDLCHVGKLGLPETIRGVSYSDAPQAFRLVPVRPATWNRRANQFHPDKTYLLAGGETRAEAKATVSWLRAHGIDVTVYKGDVANPADVQACVGGIRNLGGVFHAAMCVQPKVVGAFNLHQATKSLPLDFFVTFSSVSACFGTRSQGNYAAANTYLDALMRYRRQIGLPAATMNCGRITGMGVAAEAAALERFMEQEGFDGVNGQELMQQVEEAVFGDDQSKVVSDRGVDLYQTVTGVILTRDDVYWAAHSLFKNLYQNHDFDRHSGQKPGERAGLLLERFVDKLAVSLGASKESLKPADPIYGLDSLLAVDLRNWFTKSLGVDIALFDVMGAPSIRVLVEKAVRLYGEQEKKSGQSAPKKADNAAAPASSSSSPESSSNITTIGIPTADLSRPLPLSTFQHRLWFAHSFAEDKSFLNIPTRNPILRTAYQEGEEYAEQTVLPPSPLTVKFRDVSAAENPAEALQDLVSTLKRTQLDIEIGQLIDATLVKVTPGNYALVLIMHHICTDRANTDPLLTQISTLYDTLRSGRSLASLPAPKLNYADFTLWHNQLLESESMASHVDYWRRTLAGIPVASPLLPFALTERPTLDDYSREKLTAQIDAAQLKRIKRICTQAQSSPFQFIFSAFRAFLYRFTEDPDLTMLMVDGNRPHAEFSDLLGFFVNMTPIRCQDACAGTFEQLLRTMSGRIREAMSHSMVPFDVMVNYQQPEGQAVYQAGDFVLHKLEAQNMPSACELSLEAREDAEHTLQLQLEYSTTLYGVEDMQRFLENFHTFLCSLIQDHRQPIPSPHSWQDTTIIERVLGFADTQPTAVAVSTSEGESISYRDLVFAARRLAFSLQDAGIRPGQHVAILAEPGIPFVVSMLGRLAFIADDSQMGLLLFDEACRGLASQVRAQSQGSYALLSIREATATCVLSDVHPSLPSDPCYMLYTSGSTGTPKGVRLSQTNLLEMLAAAQQHFDFNQRDRFLHQISPSFDLSVGELWWALTAGGQLCIATKATRRSPVQLGDYIREAAVTFTYFTPTQLALVLEHNGAALAANPNYRISLLCGERLPARLADAFHKLGTSATLYNCWGPTEAVVQTTIHRCDGPVAEQLNIPIGYALGNCRHYIVDAAMNPLPPGFVGEICIGGPQVAQGYWNRPEVNRKQFVRNPFCSLDDEERGWTMLFRTGDRGRFLPDGQLEFLGRISGDKQVKLRGLRIDLGEIEHVLHRESFTSEGQGIVDLAVVARTEDEDPDSLTDDRQLVAFVVPKKPLQTNRDKAAYAVLLQARAKGSLNDYMLPGAYQFLDALPTTTSGKTDRRSLLTCPVELTRPILEAMDSSVSSSAIPTASGQTQQTAPQKAKPSTLEAVCRAWQAILKLDVPPEPTSHFFQMGGQSLLFLRLQGRLRREYQVTLSLQDMIQEPTPQRIADLIDRQLGGTEAPSQEETKSDGNKTEPKKAARSHSAEAIDWTAETTLPMDDRFHPSESHPPAVVTNILLTGADSFSGIHLLAHLLTQRPGVTVYVLGSYAPLDHGQIFQKLMEYKLLNGALTPERILTGIQVVPGFLAHESHFGLAAADFQRLAISIHAIYHLASEVSLLKTYHDLKHLNTTSALTLIELANLGRRGSRIHYLSTWSVPHLQSWEQSQRNFSSIQVDEISPIHFAPPATVDNGYFKTRWATEMLLTRAAARGFPVTIYRSSAISGNTVTGVASSDQDIVRGMVMDMVRHGVVPQAGTSDAPFVVDFIPVNYLADALGHLTAVHDTTQPAGLEVLHITNPKPLSLDRLPRLTAAIRGNGHNARSVSVEGWLEALEQAVGEDEQLRLETLRDYFLNGHNMFALSCRKANALLAEKKDLMACPPVDENYLRALWKGTA